MTAADGPVFLLDVDNTLLDNDRVQDDLRAHLASEFGPARRDRYWETFEALCAELGYADYLGALQRYRLGAMNDSRLLQMSAFLVDYPFADRQYPGALAVIEHLRRWGGTDFSDTGGRNERVAAGGRYQSRKPVRLSRTRPRKPLAVVALSRAGQDRRRARPR